MATLSHSESRCMYSWWWDSHISPKNSKWLQENLSDMDQNIKAVIKLIDEDGDSFAKRAEMFYKKRPELIQLIEEFHRAYRALAERYDHANSALRQAHQTMSEAFPDRLPPLMQPDEFEEIDKLFRKKELKQLLHVKLNRNGNETTKEFDFDFEHECSEDGEREDMKHETKHLQSEISRLLQRNENLKKQMDLESKRAQALEEGIFKLESKKVEALIQYKLSVTRISSMETCVSNIKQELCKFNHEMMEKLKSAEEQCNAMERANKIVQSKIEVQEIELKKKTILLAEVKCAIEEEYNKRMEAENSLTSLEKLHNHSKEEVKHLLLVIKNGKEKLRVMEMSRNYLEDKISEQQNVLDDLHEQNRIYKIKVRDLQNDVNLLQEAKRKSEYELGVYIEENSHLKGELCCLNEQMETVSMNNLVLENSLSDANNDLKELKEKVDEMEATCEILLSEVTTNVIEKGVFVNQIETISQYVERLSEKNTNLEHCLFDANSEIKGLRSIFRFLSDQKSILLADKNSLIAQGENLKIKNIELQNLRSNLEEENRSSLYKVRKLENHVTSFSSQIASSNNQIHQLQNEICSNVEDIKREQHNSLNFSFEILILQQSLRDMEEKFFILSREFQRLLKTARCAENVSCVMEDKVLKLQLKVDEHETRILTNQDDHINLKAGDGLTSERIIEIKNSSAVKKQEHEKLQLTSLAAQLESFVLKRCIFDMKDQNAFLYDELQKKTHEVHKCEEEIHTQLNEIQFSRVNAAIFEEKVVELLLACESLESLSMSRREILNKDIALKVAYIEELKKTLDDLKAENSTLKSDLNAFSSLLMPLSDGVLSIEEQLLSLTREKGRKSSDSDSETSDILYNDEVNHQSVETGSITTKNDFSNLRRLIAKIEDLQIVIMDTKKALAQERLESEANIKSAKKKIGQLKVDKVLVKGITKDLVDYYRVAKNDNVESDDQMLELWETSEKEDIQLVSIDKLEISNNRQSARKWYKGIIEKLNSNGLRLSVIQKNVHELKAKIEYGTFKVQLREIEYDIYDQIDITLELKNKVENSFLSDSERKKLSDEENKCSGVIDKLELETQKIEYIFLKTKEEEENKKCRCVDKKSSIISMKYLQFKKDGKVKKKGRFCGFIRPNTKL